MGVSEHPEGVNSTARQAEASGLEFKVFAFFFF